MTDLLWRWCGRGRLSNVEAQGGSTLMKSSRDDIRAGVIDGHIERLVVVN